MSYLLAAEAEALLFFASLTALVVAGVRSVRRWRDRRRPGKPDTSRRITRREARAFARFIRGNRADAAIAAWTRGPRRRGGEGANR